MASIAAARCAETWRSVRLATFAEFFESDETCERRALEVRGSLIGVARVLPPRDLTRPHWRQPDGRGIAFLRARQQRVSASDLPANLEDHERQAEDQRFRDLCSRHIPHMREHQRLLEDFQARIGAETGVAKQMLGKALGVARDLADAVRESDFLRLVGDIVTGRQSEDTFKTFREAGRALGIEELARIGEVGERHHDEYIHEANRLAQQLFVSCTRCLTPASFTPRLRPSRRSDTATSTAHVLLPNAPMIPLGPASMQDSYGWLLGTFPSTSLRHHDVVASPPYLLFFRLRPAPSRARSISLRAGSCRVAELHLQEVTRGRANVLASRVVAESRSRPTSILCRRTSLDTQGDRPSDAERRLNGIARLDGAADTLAAEG